MKVPLASYREFADDYHRARADLHVAAEFIQLMEGQFRTPPHTRLALDFYPLPDSPTPPRDGVDLRRWQFTYGMLYFRLPAGNQDQQFKLLVTPPGMGETYVIPFSPY